MSMILPLRNELTEDQQVEEDHVDDEIEDDDSATRIRLEADRKFAERIRKVDTLALVAKVGELEALSQSAAVSRQIEMMRAEIWRRGFDRAW